MKIEDLLAPTWEERRNASMVLGDKLEIYDEHLKKEIEALKPSPEIFFSKLIAYWADVSLLEFRKRMKSYINNNNDYYLKLSKAWQSPYQSDIFVKPKIKTFDLPAMMVWMFIGNIANNMHFKIDKIQLLACLQHPEIGVNETISKLLLTHKEMNDKNFLHILIEADKKGRNGTREDFWNRSDLIIKHLNQKRLNILLKDIHTNIPLMGLYSRLGVLNRIKNKKFIAKSYEYLYAKIDLNWAIEQRIQIFYSLASMSKKIGFQQKFLLYIQNYIKDENPSMRSCVVYILLIHSPFEHLDILKKALVDAHPYMLLSFCRGLIEHKELPSELFYQTILQSLDNYDACDGEPQYSAVELIISQGEKSSYVVDIIKK